MVLLRPVVRRRRAIGDGLVPLLHPGCLALLVHQVLMRLRLLGLLLLALGRSRQRRPRSCSSPAGRR